jgi:Flp pilus assembly protein TadB
MKDAIKIILICLLSTLFALAAPKAFLTETDDALKKYEALVQKVKARDGHATEAEQKEAKQIYDRLHATGDFQTVALETVTRYGLFLGIVISVMFIIGRKVNLKRNSVLIICGVTFAVYIAVGSALIGALIAALFFIANQSRPKPKPMDGATQG